MKQSKRKAEQKGGKSSFWESSSSSSTSLSLSLRVFLVFFSFGRSSHCSFRQCSLFENDMKEISFNLLFLPEFQSALSISISLLVLDLRNFGFLVSLLLNPFFACPSSFLPSPALFHFSATICAFSSSVSLFLHRSNLTLPRSPSTLGSHSSL